MADESIDASEEEYNVNLVAFDDDYAKARLLLRDLVDLLEDKHPIFRGNFMTGNTASIKRFWELVTAEIM
jgi:hypothetical protein